MFRNLVDQPFAIVIIVVAIVLLFGYKRLPDAARSIGRSMRIFKSEVKEMKSDGKTEPHGAAEPLEGRVVDEEHRPGTDPLDRRADPVRRDV